MRVGWRLWGYVGCGVIEGIGGVEGWEREGDGDGGFGVLGCEIGCGI